MPRKQYLGLLEIAREQVLFGVYAVEKGEYAELRADRCESATKLKELIRELKRNGFKVHANKG